MLQADAAGQDWLMYGGTYDNQRHSSLDQITTDNVGSLAPAWIHQTGISETFETTPVVVDGVMYFTTPERNEIVALDATTGEQMWSYDPRVGETTLCCGPNNRGVAVYHDKVYEGTLDGRLVAVDAESGEKVWEAQVGKPSEGYSITAAPLAYEGKVVTGTGGGEYGIRGLIAAYDADTGEHLWTFHTIPSPDEAPNGWWGSWKEKTPFGLDVRRDIQQEKADSAQYSDSWKRGGGASWMTPAYDPDTETLYISVGNPSPDLDGSPRPGDNLYTQSVVAIDANTGEYKWHFQYIPHGVWDLDAVSAPTIFTLNGRKVVGHAGKIGFYYILDAETGEPIMRSQNFVPMDSLFVDPTQDGVHMLPGANGGSEWSPTAYSPETHLVYVLGLHQPMTYSTHEADYPGGSELWLGSAFTGMGGTEQWGVFSAIDVRTGRIAWSRRVEVPMQGGALSTAGDVVFVGQGNGWFDAFNARSGELLWHFNTGAGVNAAPITYSVDGVQYVAVAAGGIFQIDTERGDDIMAFALTDRSSTSSSSHASPASRSDVPGFEFQHVDALRYEDVMNNSMSAPSQIVTGALGKSRTDGGATSHHSAGESGGDPPSDPPSDPPAAPDLQKFMSQNPGSKSVTYQVRAATDATNHGWNFDGYANGNITLEVPQGWTVNIHFENLDPSLPHSVGVITESPDNMPVSGDAATLAFSGAATRNFTQGIGTNGTDDFSFTASKTGSYLLFCGVREHGQDGMWVRFNVVGSADQAKIQPTNNN